MHVEILLMSTSRSNQLLQVGADNTHFAIGYVDWGIVKIPQKVKRSLKPRGNFSRRNKSQASIGNVVRRG